MSSRIHDIKEILDMMDTPGGHIAISISLGLIGTTMGSILTYWAWPDEKLATIFAGLTGAMTGFFQIAAYAMRGKERANGQTTSTTTETHTSSETK